MILSFIGIVVTVIYDGLSFNIGFANYLKKHSLIYRWSTYIFISVLIMTIGVLDESQFIYFQF